MSANEKLFTDDGNGDRLAKLWQSIVRWLHRPFRHSYGDGVWFSFAVMHRISMPLASGTAIWCVTHSYNGENCAQFVFKLNLWEKIEPCTRDGQIVRHFRSDYSEYYIYFSSSRFSFVFPIRWMLLFAHTLAKIAECDDKSEISSSFVRKMYISRQVFVCSRGNQIGFMWRGIVEYAAAVAATAALSFIFFHFLARGFKVWQQWRGIYYYFGRDNAVICKCKHRRNSLHQKPPLSFRPRSVLCVFPPRKCYQIDKMRFLRHTNIILLSRQIVVVSIKYGAVRAHRLRAFATTTIATKIK